MRHVFPAVSIRRLFLTLALFLTACSTDSCGCEGFEQRTFPANKIDVTIPAVGQARVTSSGLDYVESQVPYLISQVLPDGLNFCIPRDTSGNPDLCVDSTCDNGTPGCQVTLALDDQSITPVPSDTLEIGVVIGDINERLNFDYDATLFTVNCYVQLFKKGSSESTPATVDGNVPVRLFVDQGSDFKEVGIDVGDVTVNLEDVDFKIHGRGNVGDTITCEGASLVRGLFRGRIEDEIRGALTDAVDGIKRDQLCRHCGTGLDDCPSSSNCASDGVCEYSAAQCVPRTLGVEGRLDIGGLLGEFVREPRASVDLLAKGADLARVDTGVSVGLRGGFEASSISDCIPVDPTDRPAIRTVPASQSVTGNTRPGGGPFMLGVGLHKSAIEQVLWSAWGSGATCLEIDDEDVMLLTTTTFSLVAPSMRDLVGNADSAVLAVVANKHPTVELGANTIRPEGDSYAIDDPLLRVLWEDIDFHVFTYAQERFVRMFTLRIDLDVPVAVAPDGAGNLLLVIPDLEDAITRIDPRRLELLSESPDKIRDIVPTLLGLAAPQVSNALPESFSLPEFLGFRLDIQEGDITSVDNDKFLAVFANLERTNQPFTAVANTLITAQEISYDDVRESGFVRPQVRLDVRGYAGDPLVVDGEYEFSWRVDGGLWSLYHRTSELVVGDAVLAVQGEHVIEVRARRVGEPGSADPVPAKTIVNIEWTPEPIETDEEAGLLPPADLELAETTTIPVEPGYRPASEDKQAERGQPDTTSPSVPTPDGWKLGCSSTDARASGVWLALFVLLILASRRRWRLLLLAAGVFAAGCGGCRGELATNSPHRCLGEGCSVEQDCAVDSDCSGICPDGNGGICEAGGCVCVRACDPGCEEDSFCCPGTNECVPFGNVCTETTCDPGYEPGVTEAQPDRDSCELQDFSCDCVPLPPVPVGWHGPYTSIDSDGDLTVIATYNDAYGDLMLGTVSDDGLISWHWVDGVPSDAAIEGDPNGPRGGRVAQGPDIGTHSAVAVATGRAHVFYRDEGADVLKWGRATFDGDGPPEFESAVLDDTEGSGMWTAAVTVGSQVHVVYAVPETAEGNSEVRHVIVDANAAPAPGAPTVIVSEAVVDQGRNFPAVTGAFFDLTATGGTPFLVYWNGLTRRVGRTKWNGSAWAETTFLAANTGPYASGSLGSDRLEHVAFQQSGGFRYSRFGDTATSLAHEGLYDFGDEYWNGTAGEDSSMRLDGSNVTIAYQDAFDRVLLIGESSDGADWTTERHAIDGAGTGFWVAMTRRGDRFVADMVVDRREDPPAYVRVTPY